MSALERRLRRIVVAVAVLGIAAAIVGMFPGEQVLDDANNCLGRAFSGLFGHHGHDDCVSSFTILVATRPAGGPPLIVLVGAILAFGLLVRLHPRRWMALAWIAWTLVALVVFFVSTFRLDMFKHTETLWATPVTEMLLGAVLLLVGPVTLFVVGTSKREVTDLPSARVVSG